MSEALDVALAAGCSRLPVYQDNVDDVVGIAYAKDLMRAEHDGHGRRPGARATSGRPTSSPRPSG